MSKKKKVIVILAIAFAVIFASSLTVSFYIRSNIHKAEMISAGFHISSDYLTEEGNAEYTVAGGSGGFDVRIFNYEQENVAAISQVEMKYTVSLTGAELVSVKNSSNETLTAADGKYTFTQNASEDYHTVTIRPTADNVSVTVTAVSPYSKTLRASFVFTTSDFSPVYTFENMSDGTALLTILSNEYSGTVTLSWNNTLYSPDNTNELARTWTDAVHSYPLAVESGKTYKILFFAKTAQINELSGSGSRITLN